MMRFGRGFRRFGKKKGKKPSGEMALNITSMADVFTIILVFLLKSFATSSMNVNPSSGLSLPIANADEATFEALKVEISATAVLVEGKPMVTLKDYRFDPKDLGQNGTSVSLSGALEKERKRQLLIAGKNEDVKVDSKILIISDKKVPYSTLKAILASAAVNGYTDFKLAVVKDS